MVCSPCSALFSAFQLGNDFADYGVNSGGLVLFRSPKEIWLGGQVPEVFSGFQLGNVFKANKPYFCVFGVAVAEEPGSMAVQGFFVQGCARIHAFVFRGLLNPPSAGKGDVSAFPFSEQGGNIW